MTEQTATDDTTHELKTVGDLLADKTNTSTIDDTGADVPDWLIPNRAYDILKWVALIVLPALAVFTQVVAPAWNLPYADQIVTTLNALGVLVGAIIGASALKASAAIK
ncbi:phage holin [Bifidobacterium simiiventris]|uniref:phage holin n=1 Tax=Bifidobacterium simiiventris TaxID=2834434 RepID=UPI001C562969|nr:phage holin [Bifidobacterium simiiventris]MBW3077677.1 hypothetical protein [Bifidobacterium simiiventris]